MKPKEKTKELVNKFKPFLFKGLTAPKSHEVILNSKHCALIAVDEIIDCLSKYKGMHYQDFFDTDIFYYNAVKGEINKL